ncbi:MAG: hypothetical protein JKX84_04355, partial [Flavobacteriales bacterium]|nr:hypothetical protein [Flavobacteriales bacterium]
MISLLKTSFLLTFSLFFATTFNAEAGRKKVKLSVSERDAEIFVNGNMVGRGSALIVIPSYTDASVEIIKAGFITEEFTFFNTPGNPAPPKTHHIKMVVDDAYEASTQTDIANIDLEIKTSKNQDDAWLLLNRIIMSYIDVIEVTDKETSYLRTAWQVKSFSKATIRTRVIVKLGDKISDTQVYYKLKLVSEYAKGAGVSPKEDQSFKEWDRVLRKYEGIVSELPSRMK